MKVWIGNLGKYNEGYLVGDWLELPKTENEINDFLRNVVHIHLTHEEAERALATEGVCYEEYFIADYDEVEFSTAELGEYTPLKYLNLLAAFEDKCKDIEAVNAYCKIHNISDIEEICNVVLQEKELTSVTRNYTSNLSDDELKGYVWVDWEGGIEMLSDETLAHYIDYEQLGIMYSCNYEAYEGDMPETAGEYYCDNSNATPYEIGVAVTCNYGIEGLGRQTLEDCFDYERYGKDYVDDLLEVIDNGFNTQKLLYVSGDINSSLYTTEELFDEVSYKIEQSNDEPDICE